MKPLASQFALILAGTILFAAMVVQATSRPEDCGPLDIAKPHVNAAASTDGPTPTPAPPQHLVFVRVESDKPDIQVGSADN
jgi:hypothetical protein